MIVDLRAVHTAGAVLVRTSAQRFATLFDRCSRTQRSGDAKQCAALRETCR